MTRAYSPRGYGGSPYVNLAFAVLGKAKKDNAKMWREFKETIAYKRGLKGNANVFALACDLASYLGGE